MNLKFVFPVVALLFTGAAFSQISQTDYELIKDQFKLEKKQVVAEALHLTPKEETAFWPIYNKYEDERTAISKKSWELVQKYASSYDTLGGTQAESLIASSLKVNKDLITLRETYLKTISKQVSPAIAAKFIQLEDYLYTSIRQQFLENVPLFGDLKPKK